MAKYSFEFKKAESVYYIYEKLKSEIEHFIKYYNEKRIKEKLVWMSPVQYMLNLLSA